ncbi:O-antigen ligase family protein [Clostridium tertium]|uniref:O-antigen ligase family protein n=1 Tax=Clostridium tertium TaxID=1559 RepID=UPI00232CFA36|nr:O-antigen ligase family protein [Clostridium tertium]MDB1944573.1 O-antigen ligase family protein [Clostridium tertium]MDB1951840.1 O-antigen ligase family protein [Clostridium tertium]
MEKKNIKTYDYKILLFLFVAIPLVDIINGVILTINSDINISLGKFYRIITMIILSIITLKYSDKEFRKKHIVVFSLTLLMILAFIGVFYIYHGSFKGIIYDGVTISKLLLIFLMIYTIFYLYNQKIIDKNIITNIFKCYIIIFPLTMIIPYIIGIGSSTYSSGLGYTGLYYANNDISIVLLICTIYSFDQVIKKINILNIFIFLLNLSSLLLVGSKTGILGLVLAVILYSIYYGSITLNEKSISKKNILKIILWALLFLICTLVVFYPTFKKMIDRVIYFYNRDGNILAALLSGREKFLLEAFNNLLNERFWILKLLFGVGFFYRKEWGIGELVEMDLFDITFSLGVIVSLIIIYYLFKLLNKIIKSLNKENYVYLVCIIIMVLFSFIAGHVLFSALSGSILSLVISGGYMFSEKDEIKE